MLIYLLRNEVELDILRTLFFSSIKGEKSDIKYLRGHIIFDYLNPNLLKKLHYNRFIEIKKGIYQLTRKGFEAILRAVNSILKSVDESPSKYLELSESLYNKGLCLSGATRDYRLHEKMVKSFLETLASAGFLHFDGLYYSIADEEIRGSICYGILKGLVENGYVQTKRELEELISFIGEYSLSKGFSLSYVMSKCDPATKDNLNQILSRFDFKERPLIELIRKKAAETIAKKDWLESAAYWQLESSLHEEKRDTQWVDYCRARCYASLAIFCKRNHDLREAAKYYEKAWEVMSKYPESSKNADLQLANALECRARNCISENNFQEASLFYEQASDLFKKINREKESVYCKFRALQSQARQQAFFGEFATASKIIEEAGNIIKPFDEKYYLGAIAESYWFRGDYAYRSNDLSETSRNYREAAELYRKSGQERFYYRNLARAIQIEAIALTDSRAPYIEIAEKWRSAAENYSKASSIESSMICQADYLKNLGLDAKIKSDWSKAVDCFSQAKIIYRELIYSCENPESKRNYMSGELWFDAMIMETNAYKRLLDAIPRQEELAEVARMLAHAADLFTRVGDIKHAEIDSTFIMVTVAIDEFHKGNIPKATSLIYDARSRLPQDFVFSMFEDEIKPEWQPFRYTVEMLKSFDKYTRRIETEKGFSFESRVRELVSKIFSQYTKIEAKVFEPENDEVGIVFKDKSPIEIDAFGILKLENRYNILLAETKNLSEPVGKGEILKFVNKVKFIEVRYGKISRLESLQKPLVIDKLFFSYSGFLNDAESLAEKNGVKIFNKEQIIDLMRKHSLFPIP